jgi:hypothetical protein
VHDSEVVKAASHVGVVGAELGLAGGEGVLVGIEGGVQLVTTAENDPEVVKIAGCIGVVWT